MGEGITSVAFRRDRPVLRVRPPPRRGDVSAQAGGSRGGAGRQGARRGLWDGGAQAPNCGSPEVSPTPWNGAWRKVLIRTTPAVPLGLRLPARAAPSAPSRLSRPPPLRLFPSLPPVGAQDSARASVPADCGPPRFHSPLRDMLPPRFGTHRVRSGRPGASFQGFLCQDVSWT